MYHNERQLPITEGVKEKIAPLHGISRISNSTAAKAALIAALAAGTGCGGNVDSNDNLINQVNDIGCDPVPTCPRPYLSGAGAFSEDTYLNDQRWFRVNPETNEIIVVCDPTERDFCEEGETPAEDGCSPPVCPGAQESMCDPVPSRKEQNAPYRGANLANYPTSSEHYQNLPWIQENKLDYPVIFDSAPDCEAGETPEGDSYYRCDMIPTCESTIPYCEPLRRCEPGESPVTCEQSYARYGNIDDCHTHANNINQITGAYYIDMSPYWDNNNICGEQYDPDLNEYFYSPPAVTVNCLPVRECANGEEPYRTSITVNVDCGQWGSWTTVSGDYAPSCDPIKSCE